MRETLPGWIKNEKRGERFTASIFQSKQRPFCCSMTPFVSIVRYMIREHFYEFVRHWKSFGVHESWRWNIYTQWDENRTYVPITMKYSSEGSNLIPFVFFSHKFRFHLNLFNEIKCCHNTYFFESPLMWKSMAQLNDGDFSHQWMSGISKPGLPSVV